MEFHAGTAVGNLNSWDWMGASEWGVSLDESPHESRGTTGIAGRASRCVLCLFCNLWEFGRLDVREERESHFPTAGINGLSLCPEGPFETD